MSVYLQFDSGARSNAYIQQGGVWVPNDNYSNGSNPPYQFDKNLIQSPSNYRVFYKELNSHNNTRTFNFRAHCKDFADNINFSVESCVLTLPASALVARSINESGTATTGYYPVLDEPYLYVRLMSIGNAEGDLIYSNNKPANEATFIVWCDKIQIGDDLTPQSTTGKTLTRPNTLLANTDLTNPRWIIYRSCMFTVMRLNLGAEEWQIRIYDRYGNDVILAESADGVSTSNPAPTPDPDLQTMVLVGIRPNYE